MAPVDGGTAEFRRLPMTRCSGEGPGSEVVEWWTGFGVMGRRGLTGVACTWQRGSMAGKGH
jgi:hypothetical protein